MVSTKIEYHLVTQRGTISCIYDRQDRAEDAWRQKDPSFKILEVHTITYDVTPRALIEDKRRLSVVA